MIYIERSTAERAAARFPKLFPHIVKGRDGRRVGQDAFAAACGFLGWREYLAIPQTTVQAARDEDLSSTDQVSRRAQQTAWLAAYFHRRGIHEDAASVIAKWRPTAARPQEDSLALTQIWGAQDTGRFTRLLRELEQSGRWPTLEETAFLRVGLRQVAGLQLDFAATSVGPLCTRLINNGLSPQLELGKDLLETLQAAGDPYARVQMAQVLLQSANSGPNDFKRASDLLRAVKEGSLIERRSKALLVFLRAQARYRMQDRIDLTCFRLLRRASRLGEALASYACGQIYENKDQSVVALNAKRALRFYKIARANGSLEAQSDIMRLQLAGLGANDV